MKRTMNQASLTERRTAGPTAAITDERTTASRDAALAEPTRVEIEAERPSPARVPETFEEILKPEELARLLRVNRKTVYDAIARGEIPGVRRIGGTLRIHRETVLG